jgi:hypothetical protein
MALNEPHDLKHRPLSPTGSSVKTDDLNPDRQSGTAPLVLDGSLYHRIRGGLPPDLVAGLNACHRHNSRRQIKQVGQHAGNGCQDKPGSGAVAKRRECRYRADQGVVFARHSLQPGDEFLSGGEYLLQPALAAGTGPTQPLRLDSASAHLAQGCQAGAYPPGNAGSSQQLIDLRHRPGSGEQFPYMHAAIG